MDPNYLSRASAVGYGHAQSGPYSNSDFGYGGSKVMSGYHHYVDTAGHLHDVDHRPFPPIFESRVPPSTDRRASSYRLDAGMAPDGSWNRRSVKPSQTSPPLAYWETFSLPHSQSMYADSESSDVESAVVPSIRYNYPPVQGYARVGDGIQYAIAGEDEPVVRIDGQTGRRVLMKTRGRGKGKGKGNQDTVEDTFESEDFEELASGGDEGGGGENKVTMSPKEKLHQTWVATRFGFQLKMIRTQRWLKERVQGQADDGGFGRSEGGSTLADRV